MKFHITIPTMPYPEVYREMMNVLGAALKDLDAEVSFKDAAVAKDLDSYTIIFAPWALFSEANKELLAEVNQTSDRCILFNLEQAHPASPVFTEEIVTLMRKTFNLDYYPEHTRLLHDIGCSAATIRLFYHPSALRAHPSNIEKNIDLFFVGHISPRRAEVIVEIERVTGKKVTTAYGVWGKELDDLIARSKISLNICGHEAKSFEVMRCYPSVLNGAVVVSENHHQNVYPEAKDYTYFTDTANIAAVCKDYLDNPEKLNAERDRQFSALIKTSMVKDVEEFLLQLVQWTNTPQALRNPKPKPFARIFIGKKRIEGWRYDTFYVDEILSEAEQLEPLNETKIRTRIPAPFSLAEKILEIETNDMLAKLPRPIEHLTSWADILDVNGTISAILPYYLSPNAYDFGVYQRVFSENSFKSILDTNSLLKLKKNARLELKTQTFVPTAYGNSIYNQTADFGVFIHTPSAVDSVIYLLEKKQ